jgi:ribosomal-protein-alanine N-acetyltransferase
MSAPPGRPVPVLRGARVTLRPPAPADSEVARRGGLHPEILLGYGEDLEEWRELTAAEAAELLARLAPHKDKVEWVVEADGVFVGTARLHSFEEPHRTAAYAVGLLSPDRLGHGLGTEVTRLVSAYAFDDLGLEALTVRVLELNGRAIACYARCGFVPDHREPHVLELQGEWRDDVIMRLDADRYRELRPSWTAGGDYPEL